ncbi:hypothetical protein ETC05_06575 [Geobacillus sp. BMUD]|nr:hypothetical protein [Geobacillus sp. BMUD]
MRLEQRKPLRSYGQLKNVNNNNDENETSIHCHIKKKALTIRNEKTLKYFKRVNSMASGLEVNGDVRIGPGAKAA